MLKTWTPAETKKMEVNRETVFHETRKEIDYAPERYGKTEKVTVSESTEEIGTRLFMGGCHLPQTWVGQ